MKRIVIIFAGRQQYLECLLAHLDRQRDAFDELHLCQNARNTRDAKFIEAYAAANPDHVKLVPRTNVQLGYLDFYNQMDRQAVYLKLDDDITYIGDGAVDAMFAARLANAAPLLVSGSIVNSDRTADPNPIHEQFIAAAQAGNIEQYRVADGPTPDGRFSINAVCFYPRDLPTFDTYQSDEEQLTTILPAQLGRTSVVCGGAVFVHFSFATQGVQAARLKDYRALAQLAPRMVRK